MNNMNFKAYTKEKVSDFENMIAQQAGLSFEKQLIFGEIIGDNSWQLDMNEGVIVFGALVFPIQIIGSLSFSNNSWMWGWANTQSNIPENLLQQAYKLKEEGEEKGIEMLSNGHFSVEEGFEHQIGLLACGFFNTKSYYCANYGQGTLVVTIESDLIPPINKDKWDVVLTTFPQLISSIGLNHKEAFLNYLIDRNFLLHITDDSIEGLKNGSIVHADFDSLDRLKALNSKLH